MKFTRITTIHLMAGPSQPSVHQMISALSHRGADHGVAGAARFLIVSLQIRKDIVKRISPRIRRQIRSASSTNRDGCAGRIKESCGRRSVRWNASAPSARRVLPPRSNARAVPPSHGTAHKTRASDKAHPHPARPLERPIQVVESVRIPVVVQRAGLGPAVAQLAGGEIVHA